MTINTLQLSNQAVAAALKNNWQEAIDLNQILIENNPHEIPALNRLAKAYEETGQIKLAKSTYQKVLKIDKYSRIAQNNLDRLKFQSEDSAPKKTALIQNFSFIEEPGKTKTVGLTKLAPHQIISQIRHCLPVKLKANNRRVSVVTLEDTFIGYLPDDLSMHLIKLLKHGNQYEAAIKTVTANNIEVFLRETKKSARLKGLPSFPAKDTKYYYQFLPTEPISESPMEMTDSEYSE